jgi:hypothetical protein
MLRFSNCTLKVLLPLLILTSILLARDRTIVRFGRDVVVPEGQTLETAVAIGGDVLVYGTVNESAVAIGGSVYLAPGATVHDDAVAVGGEVRLDSASTVFGEVVEVGGFRSHMFPFTHMGYWHVPWFMRIIPFFGLLALAVVLVLLFPGQIEKVEQVVEREIGRVLLFALLGALLLIPLVLTLAVSILGIPLIPLAVLAVVVFGLFGYLALATFLGRKILVALNRPAPTTLGAVIAGLVLLWFIGLIPLAGWWIKSLVCLLGFGAVLQVLFDRRRVVSAPEKAQPVESGEDA